MDSWQNLTVESISIFADNFFLIDGWLLTAFFWLLVFLETRNSKLFPADN
jgi:hypothetical protein